MSPFDIVELTEQIAINLTPHDLTQCALVNKTWNSLFSPFVWHRVPPSSKWTRPTTDCTRDTWGDLPLREKLHQLLVEQEQEEEECHLSSHQPHHHQYQQQYQPLQKESCRRGNWHLIRFLDIHQFCFTERSRHKLNCVIFEPSPTIPHHNNEDLVLHFILLCTGLQSLRVTGQCWTQADFKFWKRVLFLCNSNHEDNYKARNAPVKELVVALLSSHSFQLSTVARLIFSRCPPKLQKLAVHVGRKQGYLDIMRRMDGRRNSIRSIDNKVREMEDAAAVSVEREQPLPDMKDLSVTLEDQSPFSPTWSLFLRRCVNLETLTLQFIEKSWTPALASCSQLKRLEVLDVSKPTLRLLAGALKDGLPSLCEITFKSFVSGSLDKELALMLSAGCAGWRVINVPFLGTLSAEALIKRHCPTLESIHVVHAAEITSTQIVQILSSSPRLHTLATIDVRPANLSDTPLIAAEDFIDLSPSTEDLTPWQCESTLKDFRARIAGIPRPDLTKSFHGHPLFKGWVKEEYFPDQGLELQRLVYERLARMHRLERLSLGFEDRAIDAWSRDFEISEHVESREDETQQYSCLQMSLASGLQALEALEALTELNITRMATMVGVEEVQWMVQKWPRLKILKGLNDFMKKDLEAVRWLREHCPRVTVQVCTKKYYE